MGIRKVAGSQYENAQVLYQDWHQNITMGVWEDMGSFTIPAEWTYGLWNGVIYIEITFESNTALSSAQVGIGTTAGDSVDLASTAIVAGAEEDISKMFMIKLIKSSGDGNNRCGYLMQDIDHTFTSGNYAEDLSTPTKIYVKIKEHILDQVATARITVYAIRGI